MSLALFIALITIALLIAIYLCFRVRNRRQLRGGISLGSPAELKNSGSEKVISDSPIYRETKEDVTQLRAALDTFREKVDMISRIAQVGSKEELDQAYKAGLPEMHRALVKGRQVAALLKSRVEQKKMYELQAKPIHGSEHCSPSSLPPDDLVELSEIYQTWTDLVYAVDGVDPCVAGFYYALSASEEKLQREHAVAHLDMAIRYLDDALSALIKLEKKLSLK